METFSAQFKQLCEQYKDVYQKVSSKQEFTHPFGHFIRTDIAESVRNLPCVNRDYYSVKASCGAGRWTSVPWIAVFDNRITKSAQHGVYIVYLLNKDQKELYLTLNQGATSASQPEADNDKLLFTGIAGRKNADVNNKLRASAQKIRSELGLTAHFNAGDLQTGSSPYDAGCIWFKKYTLDTLPDDDKLNSDLSLFIDLYARYYELYYKTNEWFPSRTEYNPEIAKEQWLVLLNNPDIIGPVWGAALAMFYTEKDGATCSALGKKYNRHPTSISGNCTQLAKRIHNETACPLYKSDERNRYWPILFLGRKADSTDPGNWIWKLRPELYEALEEFDILRFLPKTEILGVFDSWEIVDESTAIKTCDKSFFEYNGSGVPKDVCWFFGADELQRGEKKPLSLRFRNKTYTGLVRNESSDRLRTRIFWDNELGKEFDAFKGQDVRARFVKTDTNEYEITMEGVEVDMTARESIAAIKKYIAAKGFTYADGLIENFYLSLKSKPFVILAGTSGTGKTKLVKLFAEAIGATAENGRYKLVPVRPDWSDSTDLFGHTDLNNRFHPGTILDFLKAAEADRDKPYFLCLDEMNLARVEDYLSDVLSVIETREKADNGRIVSVPLMSQENYGGDADAEKKYGTVCLPENLCLIGTVNMDETTFPFSKKVLDRANTIEFSDVDLVPDFETFEVTAAPVNPGALFLKPEYLQISHCKAQREYIQTVCESLQAMNAILMNANAHVGYRVRDEICFYMLNNKNSGLLAEETAMDNEIMQKILPRIQGSSSRIREMLCDLFKYCAGDYTGYDSNSDHESMKAYLQNKGGKYRHSAEKIMSMVRRFDEDGFTSYWI